MSDNRRPRALLLDFDHTLFAFDDSVSWLKAAHAALGREVSENDSVARYERIEQARRLPEVIEEQRGCQRSFAGHRRAISSWFRRADVDEAVADALYHYLTLPTGWAPYGDVAEFFAGLRASGVPVAVVSNVGWDIRPTLICNGLLDVVDVFVLSCERGAEKPDVSLFLAACAELGVPPADALMVGDDPVNDGAAVRAGLRVHLLPEVARGAGRGLLPVLDLLETSTDSWWMVGKSRTANTTSERT